MREKAAGGVILRENKVVVVSQPNDSYSLPKDHTENDETELETSYREIYEETGLKKEDLNFIKKLEVYTRLDGRTHNQKDIHMFLFTTKKEELCPIDKENPDAMWIEIEKISEKLSFKEDKKFFLRHLDEYKNLKK